MISLTYGDRAARDLSFKIGGGQATLVAGTATVADDQVTADSAITITRLEVGGTVTSTIMYHVASVTAGTGFVINAAVAAGTINVADTSTVSYVIVNP